MHARFIYDTDEGNIVQDEESDCSLDQAVGVLERLKGGGNQLSLVLTDGIEVQIFGQDSGAYWLELWNAPLNRKVGALVAREVARLTLELFFDWTRSMRAALPIPETEWRESRLR